MKLLDGFLGGDGAWIDLGVRAVTALETIADALASIADLPETDNYDDENGTNK